MLDVARGPARCAAALLIAAGLLSGCGSSTQPELQATGQRTLTAARVLIQPSGDRDIGVVDGSVGFAIDNSGLLTMRLRVVSHAATRSTVTLTATILDGGGGRIGSAIGGAVGVDPGAEQEVQLNGAAPAGTIARVDLAIRSQAAPA